MKRLFICGNVTISIILALLLFNCQTIPKQINNEAGSWVVKITDTIFCEHYKYSEFTRVYYFRSTLPINYNDLVADIGRIDGTKIVRPEYYTIIITIAKSYSWNEIEPAIVEILKNIRDYKKQGI